MTRVSNLFEIQWWICFLFFLFCCLFFFLVLTSVLDVEARVPKYFNHSMNFLKSHRIYVASWSELWKNILRLETGWGCVLVRVVGKGISPLLSWPEGCRASFLTSASWLVLPEQGKAEPRQGILPEQFFMSGPSRGFFILPLLVQCGIRTPLIPSRERTRRIIKNIAFPSTAHVVCNWF